VGLKDFTYKENNRLIGVAEDGEPLAEYVYNGLGQRTKKVTAAGTTIFHYDQGGKLIAETDQQGNLMKDYVYLDDVPLAAVAADESI
jgi:YD repeat-containing protein